MKKLTIIFFICLLASCTKQANKQLSNIENIMLAQPVYFYVVYSSSFYFSLQIYDFFF